MQSRIAYGHCVSICQSHVSKATATTAMTLLECAIEKHQEAVACYQADQVPKCMWLSVRLHTPQPQGLNT